MKKFIRAFCSLILGLAILGTFLLFLSGFTMTETKLVTGKDVEYLVRDLNKSRKAAALKLDEELTRIAQEKALQMAQSGTISHYDMDGTITIHKVPLANVAESVSLSQSTLKHNGNRDHISLLKNDIEHRNQLLGIGIYKSHNVVGIGVAVNSKLESYCCVITAHR